MEQIEHIRESGGYLNRYTHASSSCHCSMTFSVYLPPQAETGRVPAVYWLSGLTCTDDNFRVKAGAQRYAAEHGLALVIPDTSPRGAQALVLGAKIRAILDGRYSLSAADFRFVAPAALRHRVILNYEGQAEGIEPDAIIQSILDAVPDPGGIGAQETASV